MSTAYDPIPSVIQPSRLVLRQLGERFEEIHFMNIEMIARKSDGFVNASKMLLWISQQNSSSKLRDCRWQTWKRRDASIMSISRLRDDIGVQESRLITEELASDPSVGKALEGTYVHPDLIIDIMIWADRRFKDVAHTAIQRYYEAKHRELTSSNLHLTAVNDKLSAELKTLNETISSSTKTLIERHEEQLATVKEQIRVEKEHHEEQLKTMGEQLRMATEQLRAAKEQLEATKKQTAIAEEHHEEQMSRLEEQHEEVKEDLEKIKDKLEVRTEQRDEAAFRSVIDYVGSKRTALIIYRLNPNGKTYVTFRRQLDDVKRCTKALREKYSEAEQVYPLANDIMFAPRSVALWNGIKNRLISLRQIKMGYGSHYTTFDLCDGFSENDLIESCRKASDERTGYEDE